MPYCLSSTLIYLSFPCPQFVPVPVPPFPVLPATATLRYSTFVPLLSRRQWPSHHEVIRGLTDWLTTTTEPRDMYVVDTNQSRSTIIIAAEFTHKGSVTPLASHYTTLRLPAHYATQPCCSAFQFLVSFILPFSYLVQPTSHSQRTIRLLHSRYNPRGHPSVPPCRTLPPARAAEAKMNKTTNPPEAQITSIVY